MELENFSKLSKITMFFKICSKVWYTFFPVFRAKKNNNNVFSYIHLENQNTVFPFAY
jgi:hypothetical protein